MNVSTMMRVGMTLLLVATTPGLARAQQNGTADHGTHSNSATTTTVSATRKSDQTMPDMSGPDDGMNYGQSDNTMPESRDMSGMDHGDMNMEDNPSSAESRDPHAYSGGYLLGTGEYALSDTRQLHLADEHNFGAMVVDRLEYAQGDVMAYEMQSWYGRTYDRMVIKASGDVSDGNLEESDTELLWGHSIAAFWDTQLGVRYDVNTGPDRGWLALGIQGLAPYWFEVDATAYLGTGGRTAFALKAGYELLLTQKLVLQPEIEVDLYGQDDVARGIGSGLSGIQAALRLRYEYTRQFAPYAGLEWTGKFGETADMARMARQDTWELRWVAGVRFWF